MGRFFKWALLLVILLVVSFIGYCTLPYPAYSWRQKMTITIEKNGQLIRASSVIRLRHHRSETFRGPAYRGKVFGEAVVLELAAGKYLFALLTNDKTDQYYMTELMRDVFEQDLLDAGAPERKSRRFSKSRLQWIGSWLPYVRKLPKNEPHVLERSDYPLLVTFEDINDPKTVKRVSSIFLEGAFGPSYKLKSITLEITDEPVTEGKVENVLGWFYNVNRIVPKEDLDEYRREYGLPIPGKGDFISYRSWRKK